MKVQKIAESWKIYVFETGVHRSSKEIYF